MKKIFIISTFFITLCAIIFSSCGSSKTIVPTAINTINSVSLSELNLERKDYKILNTISAEAAILYIESYDKIIIKDSNQEFEIEYIYDKKMNKFNINKIEGIARYGFLTNDYQNQDFSSVAPEAIARNFAIYRLINACKVAGGDGVIEPIVSTNVEQQGKKIIIYKTTVSAKIIKLNTDK